MANKRDYYEVLDVSRSASAEELKRVYRRLALQYHPDRNKEPGAAERFKEISEAYKALSNPEARARYDRFGHAADFSGLEDIFADFPLGDLFGDLFGFGRRGPGFGRGFGRSRARTRGSDLRYDLRIPFMEAVQGASHTIEVPRLERCEECQGSGAAPGTTPVRCSQCQGTGQVRRVQQSFLGSLATVHSCPQCDGSGEEIAVPCPVCGGAKRVQWTRRLEVDLPAGVDDDTQIRLTGEGEAGLDGGPPGDLYVVLHVEPHPYFRRAGEDILLELPLNVAQAALGASLDIPTINGRAQLEVRPGTQTGEQFRLRGHGVPRLRSGHRGDMIVTAYVIVPTPLTPEQRELLQQLGKTLGDLDTVDMDARQSKGFLDRLRQALGV